jgi:hypothetical protein
MATLNLSKITFKDREDLINQIVLKKKDIPNAEKTLTGLAESLKRYKRGDKQAMQTIIKLRKRMLNASADTYIELAEDGLFEAVTAELKILEIIDENS